MLAEIPSGCGFHAKGIGTQIDGVHVVDQNGLFVHDLFQLQSQILLLKFSFKFIGKRILAGPIRKDIVFQELLRDGAGALREVSVLDAHYARTDNTLDVDAVMVIKTGVLDGDKCVLQVLRNHVDGNRDSVGIGGNQLLDLCAFYIVYKGGKAGGGYVDIADVRCGRQNTFKSADARAYADNSRADHADQKYLHKSKCNLPAPFFTCRVKRLLFFADALFAVVHRILPPRLFIIVSNADLVNLFRKSRNLSVIIQPLAS